MEDLVQFHVFMYKIRTKAQELLVPQYKEGRDNLLQKIAALKEGMESWTAHMQLIEYGLSGSSSSSQQTSTSEDNKKKKKKNIPYTTARKNMEEKREGYITKHSLKKKEVDAHIQDNRRKYQEGLTTAVKLFSKSAGPGKE